MKYISYKIQTLTAVSAAILSLSACQKADQDSAEDENVELNISLGDGNSTSVSTSTNADGTTSTSVNSSNSNGTSSSSASSSSGDGKFSLKGNGFDINIDIPQSIIEKSGNSDDLYPGAVVTNVDISSNSSSNNGNSSSNGAVNLKFFAPDEPAKVAQYFADKFKKEGGSATLSGTNVAGKTKDGQDYKLTLDADGDGSKGLLAITGNRN